jgi:hypothetical protein
MAGGAIPSGLILAGTLGPRPRAAVILRLSKTIQLDAGGGRTSRGGVFGRQRVVDRFLRLPIHNLVLVVRNSEHGARQPLARCRGFGRNGAWHVPAHGSEFVVGEGRVRSTPSISAPSAAPEGRISIVMAFRSGYRQPLRLAGVLRKCFEREACCAAGKLSVGTWVNRYTRPSD